MRATYKYVLQSKPKFLVIVALLASLVIFLGLYLWISNDLKKSEDNFKHQQQFTNFLYNLDKLNTSITFIERNEKPKLLAENAHLALEVKMGFTMALDQINKLKQLCDNHLFNCKDIEELDSLMKNKIKFSSTLLDLSISGQSDSAINMLRGPQDSIFIYQIVSKYSAIYERGKSELLSFQQKQQTEKQQISNSNLWMLLSIFIILIIVFWNLYIQISKNDKLLSQNLIFSKLIESSNESITISNEKHELIYCNKATEKLYAARKEDIIGKPIALGLGKTESIEGVKEKMQMLDEGKGWVGEVERTDNNNNPIYFRLSINNIKNDQGKTIAHAAIASDLTNLKKVQLKNEELANNLKVLNDELEQRVQQQTLLIKDVFERVKDIFIGTDEDLNINYTNSNIRSIFDLNETEIMQKNLPELLSTILDSTTMFAIKESLLKHTIYSFQFLHPIQNIYFEASIYPSNKGLSMYFRDIDENKKANDVLKKSKRVIEFTSKVNSLIIHARTEKEIYQNLCEIAVQTGQFLMAWVGIPDILSNQVKPAFWYGERVDYLTAIKSISISDEETGRGPTGKAVRTGKYYYCNDVATDPGMEPWREEALSRGFKSSIGLPIKSGDKVVATLTIYAAEPHYFNEAEIRLLLQVTENINFALHTFQLRQRRKKAEAEMMKLKQAIDQSSASVVITNLNGEIEYTNPIFTKVTGYTNEEVIGKNANILKSGYTTTAEYKFLWQQLLMQKEWSGEFCNKKKNGELFWEYTVISPIINEEGITTNYVAVKENITERKKMEREQEELVALIENSAAYVARAEINKKLLYVNPALKEILEIGDEDISRFKVTDFVRINTKEIYEQTKSLTETNKWIGESTFKSKSGNLIPVLQVIVVHKDSNGNPSHLSTTAINISKIKEAEKELLRVNTELTDLARHLQYISEIEKKEIARDIHDELGQNLAVLNMKVAWIKKHLQDSPDKIDQKIDELANSIKHTMTGFRRIHSSLHPAMLEQLGLEATIKWLISSIQETGNMEITFNCVLKTKELKLDISLPLYRVTQEAFTNILRYAKATKIQINLSETANAIFLTIEDNGCGFIIEAVDSKLHHGILGMRERIYAVKGHYEIESALGKGTKINIKVPLLQTN